MTRPTLLHRAFFPLRKALPAPVANLARSLVTALATPVYFSAMSGHFISSFKRAAVSRRGQALPWYTYPCIDFLRTRDFQARRVLEFGGGQSTLWWASRASQVVTFEGDRDWYERIRGDMPANVALHAVSMQNAAECTAQIRQILTEQHSGPFDVVVIDGLYRSELIPIALEMVSDNGAIICDNAEGYGFHQGFKNKPLQRVDFFGHTPGVMVPHCTAIYFLPECFLFSPEIPVPVRD